jgi:hypothetical protein
MHPGAIPTAQLTNGPNMLECLFLARLYGLVLCLWVRPGAYHRLEHLKDASLRLAQFLHSNIRLVLKGLPGANTLAY